MQRKALKQLNKVTQWTNEKVFSGEKTQLSAEFTEFEREIEIKRSGIERLHATSMPFFENITKVKQTNDPHPPQGSGKDKILYTEALGLVMIDYGGDLRDAYGDALAKYGRSRCKLAIAQEEFGNRLNENYIAGMERALEAVNDYKTFRKKLDSRRLALDANISKLNGAKKEKDRAVAEQEVELSRERFEEIEEETCARMEVLQNESERPFHELSDLLEAELEYHSKCRDILEELRDTWPSGSGLSSTSRPRAKSNASARSATSRARTVPSSDDETPNRHRAGSASSVNVKKEKKGFMSGFSSFGKKTASAPRRKERDYEAQALNSADEEEEDEDDRRPYSPSGTGEYGRSNSTLNTINPRSTAMNSTITRPVAPALRRNYTSPGNFNARYVKALYEYSATQTDELGLRVGQVVEVKSEISSDWWTGESEGKTGMFPAKYCEEYVPTPATARAVPPTPAPAFDRPARTSLPPVRTQHLAPAPTSSTYAYESSSGGGGGGMSDSEVSQGYDDADHYATASLSAGAQAQAQAQVHSQAHSRLKNDYASTSISPSSVPSPSAAVAGRSRSSTINSLHKKGPAPPPPPSRRSASSTNVLSMAGSPSGRNSPAGIKSRSRSNTASSASATLGNRLAVPPSSGTGGYSKHSYTLESSPEGSPFGGGSPFGASDDEGASSIPAPAPSQAQARAQHQSQTQAQRQGMTRAMSGLKLPTTASPSDELAAAQEAGECASCGCDEFRQNLFKPKGNCASCYHLHA